MFLAERNLVTSTRATEKWINAPTFITFSFPLRDTKANQKETKANKKVTCKNTKVEFIRGFGIPSPLRNILTRRIGATSLPVPCPLSVEPGKLSEVDHLHIILTTLLQSLETSLYMWCFQQENGQRCLCDLIHLRWHFISLLLKFEGFYWSQYLNLLWLRLVCYLILLKR